MSNSKSVTANAIKFSHITHTSFTNNALFIAGLIVAYFTADNHFDNVTTAYENDNTNNRLIKVNYIRK